MAQKPSSVKGNVTMKRILNIFFPNRVLRTVEFIDEQSVIEINKAETKKPETKESEESDTIIDLKRKA